MTQEYSQYTEMKKAGNKTIYMVQTLWKNVMFIYRQKIWERNLSERELNYVSFWVVISIAFLFLFHVFWHL